MNNKKRKHYEHKYIYQMQSQFRNFKRNSNIADQKPSTSCTMEKPDIKAQLKDTEERGTIMRDTLYEDPDLFNFSQEANFKFERLQGWLKSGEDSSSFDDEHNEIYHVQNKIQRDLNKMLEKPVQVTKAERMMSKMGWEGGALGKHGDGIIVPIAPNASYATKTVGLGQTAKRMKSLDNKVNKDECKENFCTNVLFHILNFVKNDLQNEIAFDCRLSKKERKWVHHIVEALANSENAATTDFDTTVQVEIAQEIFKFNNYSLTTESEGVFPNRSLCLYKEAPENVYLVTPDDLKEDREHEDDDRKQDKKQTTTSCTDNSVVVNIPEIKKDPKNTANKLTLTIIEYFTEFVKDCDYSEFRFLGPFSSEEMDAINSFVDGCTRREFEDNNALKDIFNNNIIEVKENCNGNIIFCKTSKNQQGVCNDTR